MTSAPLLPTAPPVGADVLAELLSPSVVIDRDALLRNVDRMLSIAGGPARLRPHCKTHKMSAVTRLELARGITRHKAATFAEAEMLAESGVPDVLLAYNIVGPNIARAIEFRHRFPQVRFAVTADHPLPIEQLGRAMSSAGQSVDVLLDLNIGMNRTGIVPSQEAAALYASIATTPGLRAAGLHAYDGHLHQTDLAERTAAVHSAWQLLRGFLQKLRDAGQHVEQVVVAGTGTFPIWADIDEPGLELSPGTPVLYDAGYRQIFPDLAFEPAAWLLTRVVSHPIARRVTLDLGNKAVAADPPAGTRVVLPGIPDAQFCGHNEEHLIIETDRQSELPPGTPVWALPRHVCPTMALHRWVYVVGADDPLARWDVSARDRFLTL